MSRTAIEWTDRTWNPTTGCDRVSPGCDHCYAMTMAKRLKGMGSAKYQNDGDPRTSGPGFAATAHVDSLDEPKRWRKPARVFVNSMSDLFHDDIPERFILGVFGVMAQCPQHTFQILTKRHARMRSMLTRWAAEVPWLAEPLSNVWLGVSVENQKWADIRIPALLGTPAAVRFISAEPLLGDIDLTKAIEPNFARGGWMDLSRLHWVIAGGESGPGARPMHPDWARSLRNQCVAAHVPFLFKQWGEWAVDGYDDEDGHHANIPRDAKDPKRLVIHRAGMTAMHPGNTFNPFERGHPFWATAMRRVGKKSAGRELDGRTWDEFPEEVAR